MIELHKQSEELIKETFDRYTKTAGYVRGEGTTIIHLYPVEDTKDPKTGEVNGFVDSLFFNIKIYDINKRVYTEHCSMDGIHITKAQHVDFRVFKDGSTMIVFPKPINIMFGSCMFITEVKENGSIKTNG